MTILIISIGAFLLALGLWTKKGAIKNVSFILIAIGFLGLIVIEGVPFVYNKLIGFDIILRELISNFAVTLLILSVLSSIFSLFFLNEIDEKNNKLKQNVYLWISLSITMLVLSIFILVIVEKTIPEIPKTPCQHDSLLAPEPIQKINEQSPI